MFYLKQKIFGDTIILREIHADNVYTRCPCCGKEFTVDLAAVFQDGESGLEDTLVLCDECSEETLEGIETT